MAEKSPKKPGEGTDPGVLASLPSTRPNRLSRRGREGDGAAPKAAADPAAKPAAAKRKPKAKARAKAKAKAKPGPAPTPIAAAAEKQRPTAVRAAHPTLGKPAAPPPDRRHDQSGIALVKTVVQAAGEVAQIGATVGGQILKRAVDRLPKRP